MNRLHLDRQVVRIGLIAIGAALLAGVILVAVPGVLRSPSCTVDPVFERSGDVALLGGMIGGVALLLTAPRRSTPLAIVGATVPLVAITFHRMTIPRHHRQEQQCRDRSLAQALGRCGETLDRYRVTSDGDSIGLTPKPGVPVDRQFICFARWAQWGSDVLWNDGAGSMR